MNTISRAVKDTANINKKAGAFAGAIMQSHFKGAREIQFNWMIAQSIYNKQLKE